MSTLFEAAQAVKEAIENGSMNFQRILPLCEALDAKPEVVRALAVNGGDGALSDYLFASYVAKKENPNANPSN